MKYIFLHTLFLAGTLVFADQPTARILIDFEAPGDEPEWQTVNDNVMGGRSKGGYTLDEKKGLLVFTGSTNTDGGGFSSIRTQAHDWKLDEVDGMVIRFRSDSRTYQADLRKKGDRGWIPVAYRADIPADKDSRDWQTVRIPLSEFSPTRMGRAVKGSPMTASELGAIGFMIYDKQDGPFKLEVDWVGVYSDAPAEIASGDMGPLGE